MLFMNGVVEKSCNVKKACKNCNNLSFNNRFQVKKNKTNHNRRKRGSLLKLGKKQQQKKMELQMIKLRGKRVKENEKKRDKRTKRRRKKT